MGRGWVWKAASENSFELWCLSPKGKTFTPRGTEQAARLCEALGMVSGSLIGSKTVVTLGSGAERKAETVNRPGCPVVSAGPSPT